MTTCEFTETCIFFNELMADMPSSVNVYKQLYCEANFKLCARYMVKQAMGSDSVPLDLFPHQKDRVGKIIARGRR